MESEDWLRNCGPIHGLGVTIAVTWRLILILSWWWDGREMEPWEGDICFRSPGLCWCHKWQYCDTNDISWDANKTGSYCTDMPVQILGIFDPVLTLCMELEYVSRAALKSTHESCVIMTPSTLWRGKCCENLCCHHLVSPTLFITTSEFISTAPPGPE